MLILDEPTNNLDLEAVAALADCVESFKGVSCVFLMCFSSYCCYYKCMAKHSIAMLACSLGHAIQEKNCARSVFFFFSDPCISNATLNNRCGDHRQSRSILCRQGCKGGLGSG